MSRSGVAATVRRGRPRDESIDAAVLEATIDQLIEHGLLGLSMEAVAAQAGVAKTSIYRRWPNTTELAVAALRRLKGEALEPPPGTVREQLGVLIDQLYRTWSDERFAAILRRVAADARVLPDVYRESRDRLVGPNITIMRAVLRRGVDEGLIRDDLDLEMVRELIVSSVTASAFALRPLPSRAQVDAAVDLVLRGAAP